MFEKRKSAVRIWKNKNVYSEYMNIIIKLFINKGYIYYAIFNTFFSIFLNRKFIRFIKKMLKVIRVWCFFLTCIAIYWPFPEKKKKMNSLTSRKIVAVGQGHVLSTNLSFLLKTLLFTRLFRPHFSYSIFHSIPFKDHSIQRSFQGHGNCHWIHL